MNSTVRRIVGPTILLSGGAYFDFLDPESCPFTINDIAHALSMICRFAGHCERFYSVAEHSVNVSRFVPLEHAFAGLLHDAAEAFVGDVSKPLKELLPEYRLIEERIEAVIFSKFGLPNELPPEIKEADIRMLVTEQRQLMRNRDDWDYTRGRDPLPIALECLSPTAARALFLNRFELLRRSGR